MAAPPHQSSEAYFAARNDYYHAYDEHKYGADKKLADEREEEWKAAKQAYKDLLSRKDMYKYFGWDDCKPSFDEKIIKYEHPVREAEEELKRRSNTWASACNSAAGSAIRVAEMRFQAMLHPNMVWYKDNGEQGHKDQIKARLDNATRLTDHAKLQMKPFPFLQVYHDSMPSRAWQPSSALLAYLRGHPIDYESVEYEQPWWDEQERKCSVEDQMSPRTKRAAEQKAKYDALYANLTNTFGRPPTEEEISMYWG